MTTEIHLDSFESEKRAGISRHLLPVGREGWLVEEVSSVETHMQ